ncbi:transposase, partial [Bacteroides sp. Ga6A2]
GLKANMKNKLMSLEEKILLRKRCIIECINDLLKNKANLVHSRHRSIHNFIMNICSALTAYCFFENKPDALPVHVEKSRQLELFEL